MKLNEIEQCILVAEKEYGTAEEKVRYVNLRLKRIRPIIDPDNNKKIIGYEQNPLMRKAISQSQYYKLLGGMITKTNDRGHLIAKTYLTELINEHDTLLQERIEMREFITKSEKAEKFQTAFMAKKEKIDLGRRILSVKELIKVHMEEPDLDDEEQLERQIQLLSSV